MFRYLSLCLILVCFLGCQLSGSSPERHDHEVPLDKPSPDELAGLEKAYFASGCFWCVEAIFESVRGVEEVISGYSGGEIEHPTYEQVSSGRTKHAEAVEVYYNPEVVTYGTLVKVFFGSHDPTTLNRQGPDRGPQYRSALFYQNDEEKAVAEQYIKDLSSAQEYSGKIVTQVVPFTVFWP
ncbi:MAG: peptide-methionine (S)-S-oxide reductase MsrA, partial [Bacteroidota bacterium]